MTRELTIKLQDLRSVINGIFDHIENDLGIKSIDLQHDYYHDFSLREDLYKTETPVSGMGQLFDDWKFLEKLLKDKDGSVALMFDHVAPLLRYLAYRIGQ